LIAKQLPRLIKEFDRLRGKQLAEMGELANKVYEALIAQDMSKGARREVLNEFMSKANSDGGVADVEFDDDIPF
jgi:hypothetical protein